MDLRPPWWLVIGSKVVSPALSRWLGRWFFVRQFRTTCAHKTKQGRAARHGEKWRGVARGEVSKNAGLPHTKTHPWTPKWTHGQRLETGH